MLTAVLFDLDGTLVNTDPLHYQTWQEMLRDYGLEIDQAFYKARISGRLNPLIVQDLLPHLSFEAGQQLADYKEARFREIGLSLTPLAGLLDLLAWIETQGLRKAVVTNAPRENVNFLLEVLKLADTFDRVVLAEDAIAGKPDPAPYKLALSLLGVSPKEAIAFEDSCSGIHSAVGAGIYTIGVASTHDPEVLLEAGAAMVIPDFTEKQLQVLLDSLMETNSAPELPVG
ncbi:MAG TPA: HAD family phosphatase [Oculatellaceae cyanobacterium]